MFDWVVAGLTLSCRNIHTHQKNLWTYVLVLS